MPTSTAISFKKLVDKNGKQNKTKQKLTSNKFSLSNNGLRVDSKGLHLFSSESLC